MHFASLIWPRFGIKVKEIPSAAFSVCITMFYPRTPMPQLWAWMIRTHSVFVLSMQAGHSFDKRRNESYLEKWKSQSVFEFLLFVFT